MIQVQLPNDVTLEARLNNERTLGQAFAAIANWNTEDIRERLLDGDVVPADQVDTAIEECRKFFMCIAFARAMNAGSVGMMSKVVDEVWHNAILFTHEYFELSAAILGEGRYLHHAPVVKSRVQVGERNNNVFATTYHQLFGRIPEIWGVKYVNQQQVWADAMQGLCVTDQFEDSNLVCHPDSCKGGEGQLCRDLPTCKSDNVVPQFALVVCHPESCKGGDGQLCSDLPTCNSDGKAIPTLELVGCIPTICGDNEGGGDDSAPAPQCHEA